jgi:MSHA pilin protein MshA
MKKKFIGNNEKGFTLIEIIAVLVILGILAAIALPKYFDMQGKAREKALDGAIAEGVGRINAHFGKALLAGSTPAQVTYTNATLGSNAGDFTLTFTDGASITVKALGNTGGVRGQSKTRKVSAPGT